MNTFYARCRTLFLANVFYLLMLPGCNSDREITNAIQPIKDTSAKLTFAMVDTVGGGLQIFRMNIDGSDLMQLTYGDEILESDFGWWFTSSYAPEWSPDGTHILFKQSFGPDEEHSVVMDEFGRHKKVISWGGFQGSFAMWNPSGDAYLVRCYSYCADHLLTLVDSSGNQRDIPRLINPYFFEGDSLYYSLWDIGWHPDGQHLFVRGNYGNFQNHCPNDSGSEIFLMDVYSGEIVERMTFNNVDECGFIMSPSGDKIVAGKTYLNSQQNLFVMDLSDSAFTRITNGQHDWYERWANDGQTVLFKRDSVTANFDTKYKLMMINVNEPFHPKVISRLPIAYHADLYINEEISF